MADHGGALPDISVPDIDRCVGKYVYDKTFSAAACVASVGGQVFHRAVYGSAVTPPPLRRLPVDALFDLGHLTMPLGTGLAALYLASRSRIDLASPLSRTLHVFRDEKFDNITIDMLLDHTSGLPAIRSFWSDIAEHDAKVPSAESWMGKTEAADYMKGRIADVRLEAEPGRRVIYSELGFMVLGWIIEGIVGKPLDVFLEREIYRPLGIADDLFFVRLDDVRRRQRLNKRVFAATETCAWRDQTLQGEVHNANAWAMGGVAGHAGLFGTADAVWRLMHTMWGGYHGRDRTFLPGTVQRFWRRSQRAKGITRTLAWDTPAAHNSVVGTRFSRRAVGHTANTGASVWVDLANDCICVMLSNCLHPTIEGKDEKMKAFRPRLHDHVAKEADALPPDPTRARGSAAFSSSVASPAGGLPRGLPKKP